MDNNLQEFRFNTGVKVYNFCPPVPCVGEYQIVDGNGVKIILFYCTDVPKNATFLFACDNPNLQESKANNEIFQAQQYFQQAVDATAKPDSLYNLALKGGEGKLGFVGIAEQYAGTSAGNLANYYAGMAYLNLGDFKNAITYLENFKSDDAILKPLALGAIGDAFSETNKVDDAISYYKKAAEASENDFTTPRYLLKAAQLNLAAGKKAEAHKLFVEIKVKYETSKEGMNIDAFIAMTE